MKLSNQFAGLAAVGALSLLAPAGAGAAVINFDSRQTGEIIAAQYANYEGGLIVRADNFDPAGPDVATIFHASSGTIPDPDLRTPYSRGNLPLSHDPKKILIIPENATDANGNGRIDVPNDEKSGGQLDFTFGRQLESLGFDLIDVEGVTSTDSRNFTVRFFQGAVEVGEVPFSEFVRSDSDFYQSSVRFGDDSINRIQPIAASEFGVEFFNRVIVQFGGSAAIDRLHFHEADVVVPEPGTAALAVLGLTGVLASGRRCRCARA